MSDTTRTLSLDQAFALARDTQANGDLADAKRLYERILTVKSNYAAALTLLASIHYQRGDDIQADAYLDRSTEIYRRRTRLKPDNPQVVGPLVNQLLARGRHDEAIQYLPQLPLQMMPVRSDAAAFARTREQAIAAGRGPMIINTVPKSASETIWNRLASGLGMAQSHISIGLFPDCYLVPYRLQTFRKGGIIAKEHIPARGYNLAQLREAGIDRIVFHLRDPRQAALSWAHFVKDDVSMRLMAPIWRKVVPPASVLQRGMDATLDWSIDDYMPHLIQFVREWDAASRDPDTPITVKFFTFEDFRRHGDAYFAELLEFYGLSPDSFDPHAEAADVHFRKGEPDEWRSAFTRRQAERAWRQIPRDLAERFAWQR